MTSPTSARQESSSARSRLFQRCNYREWCGIRKIPTTMSLCIVLIIAILSALPSASWCTCAHIRTPIEDPTRAPRRAHRSSRPKRRFRGARSEPTRSLRSPRRRVSPLSSRHRRVVLSLRALRRNRARRTRRRTPYLDERVRKGASGMLRGSSEQPGTQRQQRGGGERRAAFMAAFKENPHLPLVEPRRARAIVIDDHRRALRVPARHVPRELEGVLRADQEAGHGGQHRPRDQALRRERLPDAAAREGGPHARQQGPGRDRRCAEREARRAQARGREAHRRALVAREHRDADRPARHRARSDPHVRRHLGAGPLAGRQAAHARRTASPRPCTTRRSVSASRSSA